ncbi:toprim domain-containing protein [uncultured Bacteroides sp.]|uniref:toprim domain-containing protein n=1 Tax=uncultured Bacteroides sp. TaxID=162156 RepID=UPI00266F8171|nr:toprim domain-containing protein [uncultured Bacteroides sp.]
MITEIKNIRIADFLSSLGYEPAMRKGNRLWYRSPLRQEKTPSFKIETDRNTWYDFGLGRGGDIIDLAKLVYRSDNIGYISDMITRRCPVPSVQKVALSFSRRHSTPSIENFETVPLVHPALLAYLKERAIPAHIAKARCSEAHYTLGSRRYFAVAFPNVSGGHELRNKYFKGCSGHKDISLIPFSRDGPTTRCAVFEGFIDYLSSLTLGIIPGCDAVVLNSVANVNRAIPSLCIYSHVGCFLDNDDAGKTALHRLTDALGTTVTDCSSCYNGYNDLNDYLVSTADIDCRGI